MPSVVGGLLGADAYVHVFPHDFHPSDDTENRLSADGVVLLPHGGPRGMG